MPGGITSKSKQTLNAIFHEVHHEVPKVVQKTERKKGKAAAEKQMVAIALSKARRAGIKT